MKKILFALILIPFLAACSSDDGEDIDLTKYPLYNTKWVYYNNETEPYNNYYSFKKNDGIYGNYLTISNEQRLFEDKISYTYNAPNITIQLENQYNNPPSEGYIENDTLYLKNSKYYKVK